jgi:hypothetical protein
VTTIAFLDIFRGDLYREQNCNNIWRFKGFRVAKLKGVLGFRVAKCKGFRGCKIGYSTLILFDFSSF